MIRTLFVTLTLALLLVFPGRATPIIPASPSRPAPELDERTTAVMKLLSQQVECWNKKDLDGFLKPYWNDDNLTFYSGGNATLGFRAVTERYRKNYQADGKEMGELAFSKMSLRILGPDTVLVLARWDLKLSKETMGGLFTLIVEKRTGGWVITHDHTSRDDPPKKPS